MNRQIVALALAAAAAASLALPAHAGGSYLVTISAGDIDLATSQGRSALEQRIAEGALQACGSAATTRAQECRDNFTAGARDQLLRSAAPHYAVLIAPGS
ncbi:UrcA family protein [Sphingosinicella sp. LY1275]|uniref:UrcA family protein n=1 Tax=Sphingosinicella sp. LY1275 TaxID=3095379 RepID=UPI002ADEDE5B|nr:UrcA family protein [Sphingosinicella sp. LY1275]MEA1014097.1 UrcA family protein [Sphingosinicella sp. LY1275]